MAVPKKKTSKSRRDMRRSHLSLKKISGVALCPECNSPRMPHTVCAVCGKYGDKQIFADRRVAQNQ